MKLMNVAKRYGKSAVLSAVLLGAASAASANTGVDFASIGQSIATIILGFVALISAIGMAAITVIMGIQGFKMAFNMIKTVK